MSTYFSNIMCHEAKSSLLRALTQQGKDDIPMVLIIVDNERHCAISLLRNIHTAFGGHLKLNCVLDEHPYGQDYLTLKNNIILSVVTSEEFNENWAKNYTNITKFRCYNVIHIEKQENQGNHSLPNDIVSKLKQLVLN